ncbi:A24 family peptidase C-terminal domain-containing protein [Methanobacterium sp. ACI-7]|uniref:A24 family peptidase C-terminal domain-containing protein n=1 Tax=unclassified Methanobacterium TaxID=2627676 RepID=UPI0039C2771B
MIPDIPLLCTMIAIIACIYASYTDLKSGIIQNKLTFPLIGLGIVFNGIYAFIAGNIWLLIYAVIFTAGIFVLGYALWKIGAWAGGDVKLFTALAALIPFYPALVNYSILGIEFPISASYIFPLTLIINSILAILPFLFIFTFYIVIRKKRYLLDDLIAPAKEYRKNIVLTLVITSAVTLTFMVTSYLPFQIIILSLVLIYILTAVISKLPSRIKAVIVSVLTIFALYNNLILALGSITTLFISITVIGIIIRLLTSVNKKALQDDYRIDDLKEGMISVYNIYEKDEKIYVDDRSFFAKIRESIKKNNISSLSEPKGKLLISTMAAGISKKDIELLNKLHDENKIKEIKIKKGVPFAPSILIGLLISLFIGDLAVILQKVLYLLFT